jgi:multimeric flavodoxin WrbA
MKIVAVLGSCRKNGSGAGYMKNVEEAARKAAGNSLEFEYLWLGDYDIKACRGCMVCYDRGEAACPLKDGYLNAMKRLNEADAAVFYSPTYTLSISGLMKTFFDRSSFVLHRPYFKGRPALVYTAVEAYGESTALATLKMIVSMMGFSVSGTAGIVNMKFAARPAYRQRTLLKLEKQAALLTRCVSAGWKVRPTLIELIAFQYQKAIFGADIDACRSDRKFWREAGWTDRNARFYCDAGIPFWKLWLARLLSVAASRLGILPQ